MKIFLLLLITISIVFGSTNKCNDVVLDLKITDSGVKLSSIIENIAKECEYSIFYENEGEHIKNETVGFITLKNRTPNDIIGFLLSKYNYNHTLENNSLTISKYMTKTFKVDFLDSPRESKSNVNVAVGGSGGVTNSESKTTGNTGANIEVAEKFDFWESLEKDLYGILNETKSKNLDNEKIIINKKAGFVTVKGDYRDLQKVEHYLNKLLDTLKKQVIIDVKVISVTLDNSNKVGIDWSQLSASYTQEGVNTKTTQTGGTSTIAGITNTAAPLPLTNSWVVSQSSFNVDGFLNFLRTYGKTKSLSNPKILAMNNQPSLFSVGDNVNYGITTSTTNDGGVLSESVEIRDLFVGVLLDITPQIDNNGYVTLKINPSISDFKFAEDATLKASRTLPPDTVSRRISTVARVKDGDVVILGGLINNTKSNIQNKVWLLGDIPFLGWLFKSEDITDVTTEIVFVLTPRIIKDDKQVSLKDLGFKIDEKVFNEE